MIIATVLDLLADCTLVSSRRDARQLIESGGFYLNDQRITDPARKLYTRDLLHGRFIALRKGRRNYQIMDFGPFDAGGAAALAQGD